MTLWSMGSWAVCSEPGSGWTLTTCAMQTRLHQEPEATSLTCLFVLFFSLEGDAAFGGMWLPNLSNANLN